MKGQPIPVPSGQQLYDWATKLVGYLRTMEREIENPAPKALQLEHAKDTARATTNGLMMWDNTEGAVIVAKDGAWYKLDMTPLLLRGMHDKRTR